MWSSTVPSIDDSAPVGEGTPRCGNSHILPGDGDMGETGAVSPSVQSVSSCASARRLEWDSAADVGYRQPNSVRNFQSLDTLERIAIGNYRQVLALGGQRLCQSSTEVANVSTAGSAKNRSSVQKAEHSHDADITSSYRFPNHEAFRDPDGAFYLGKRRNRDTDGKNCEESSRSSANRLVPTLFRCSDPPQQNSNIFLGSLGSDRDISRVPENPHSLFQYNLSSSLSSTVSSAVVNTSVPNALIYTSCDTLVALPGSVSHCSSPPFSVPFPDSVGLASQAGGDSPVRGQISRSDRSDSASTRPRAVEMSVDRVYRGSGSGSGQEPCGANQGPDKSVQHRSRWSRRLDGDRLIEVTERWRRVDPSTVRQSATEGSNAGRDPRSGLSLPESSASTDVQFKLPRHATRSTGDLSSSRLSSRDSTNTGPPHLARSSVSLDSCHDNQRSADDENQYSWQCQLTRSELQFLNNNNNSSSNADGGGSRSGSRWESLRDSSEIPSVPEITQRLGLTSLHATTSSDNDVPITVRSVSASQSSQRASDASQLSHSQRSSDRNEVSSSSSRRRGESRTTTNVSSDKLADLLSLSQSEKRCLARVIRQHRQKHKERFVREMKKLQQWERKLLGDVPASGSPLSPDADDNYNSTNSGNKSTSTSSCLSDCRTRSSQMRQSKSSGSSKSQVISTTSTASTKRSQSKELSALEKSESASEPSGGVGDVSSEVRTRSSAVTISSKTVTSIDDSDPSTRPSGTSGRSTLTASRSAPEQSSKDSDTDRLKALLTESVRADELRAAVKRQAELCKPDARTDTTNTTDSPSCQCGHVTASTRTLIGCCQSRVCGSTCTVTSGTSDGRCYRRSSSNKSAAGNRARRTVCCGTLPVRRSVAYFLTVDKSWTRKATTHRDEEQKTTTSSHRRILPEVKLNDFLAKGSGVESLIQQDRDRSDAPSSTEGTQAVKLQGPSATSATPSDSEVRESPVSDYSGKGASGDGAAGAEVRATEPVTVTTGGSRNQVHTTILKRRTRTGPATENETVSLQEALACRRPDYVRNAGARQDYIRSLVAVRLYNQQQITRLAALQQHTLPPNHRPIDSPEQQAAWNALRQQFHQIPKVKRAFNYWDMRRHTSRLCRRLTENRQTIVRQRRKETRLTNQIVWKMYRQKLQELCLQGRVDMTHGVNVLAT